MMDVGYASIGEVLTGFGGEGEGSPDQVSPYPSTTHVYIKIPYAPQEAPFFFLLSTRINTN